MRLQMALPRKWSGSQPFPFNSELIHYYYLARNGLYALANAWKLAGQEILFPAYCHGIEIETLCAAGVQLRFYPVSGDMRVDTGCIKSRLTSRTRAVYLIHYLGFPGPVEELAELCRSRDILLIEDCALALLSKLGNVPLGSFGDASVFCISKTLPVPNGGALVLRTPGSAALPGPRPPTLSSTLAYTATAIWRDLNLEPGGLAHRTARKIRSLARSKSESLGVVQMATNHLDTSHLDLGMSRMCEWVVAAQDFDGVVERRRRNYLYLLERLREISAPVFGELPPGVCPLFYPLRTRNKIAVIEGLLQRGIEPVNFWSEIPPATPEGTFPEVDRLRQTVVELPCHQDLTPDSMEWIASEVVALRREAAG
jgi:dTDP-4-amino-4,6-dideoxygalactose transaminase